MYSPLKEKKIINDEDIDKINEKFKENENINKLITEIKNNNNKNNNNDQELLKSIDLQLNNYFGEEGNNDNKIALRGKKKVLTKQDGDSNINRQLSFITSSLLYNKEIENSDKVSMINNPEITNLIDSNINLIKKNYNELINDNNNNELNENRNNIITNSLANLKKLCISKDNHKYILDSGLLNFIENLSDDLKSKTDNNNIKNYLTNYNVQSKDILQCTSNSENCIPLIINSSVFPEITSEYINFYNSADLLADNPINQKLFLYDNIIFSNVCKSKKGFDLIFNEIGLEKIIDIGYNTNNIFLLESIISLFSERIFNF